MGTFDPNRLREIVRGGRGLAPAKLAAYLEHACGADLELHAEAEALLAVDPADLARFDALVRPQDGAAALLAAGDDLGGFRLLARRGGGATGTVYRAVSDEGEFALKVLHPWLAQGGALRRFRGEARMQSRLDHPGIARVERAESARLRSVTHHFLVMEYVHGAPLHHWLLDHRATREQAIELLIQVCDAVAHAHRRQVIHCDLKPENILVDELGRAKVVDFGIARVLDEDRQLSTRHSSHADLLGTLPYMSPEQLDGESREIDAGTDVYALGVVAYQVLARRLPIDVGGLPPWVAAQRLRDVEPPNLSQHDRALGGNLEAIVAKAMEKDPRRRYATVAELADDLRSHREGKHVTARLPGRLERARRFAVRNTLLVGSVAAIVLVLSAGVVATSVQAARARGEAARAERGRDFLRETLVGARNLRAAGSDRRVSDLLADVEARLDSTFASDPALAAMVAHTVADAYAYNGELERAEPLLERAGTVATGLGDTAIDIQLDVDTSRGVLEFRRGRLDEAEVIFREVHARRVEHDGADAMESLTVLGWRARALEELGRFAEAEDLQREQLAGLSRPGADVRHRFESVAALAKLLKLRGALSDAEQHYREVLEWQRAHVGVGDPETLVTQNNLASLLLESGRGVEAHTLLEGVVRGFEAHFGPEHHDVIAARNNLEAVRLSIGKAPLDSPVTSAVPAPGTAAPSAKPSAATLSIETLDAYRAFENGEYERAEGIYSRAQRGFETLYGATSTKSDMVRVPRAAALHKLARPLEARALLEGVIENQAAANQLDSLTATGAMTSLGRILSDLGEHEEAEAWCREGFRRVAAARIDNPLLVLRTRTNLARAAEDRGFVDEARDLWSAALAELRGEPVTLATTWMQYAKFLERRGRLAEARSFLIDACALFESRADVPAVVARECYAAAADVCEKSGDRASALSYGVCAMP